MERDLAAIQAKLDSLEAESQAIGETHPEEAALIRERITQITTIWQELTVMVFKKDIYILDTAIYLMDSFFFSFEKILFEKFLVREHPSKYECY